MITKDYKQNKKEVLKIYDEYLNMCKSTNKEVGGNIKEQAEKIRDEIFNLMVLGEAKSGKSTFINAYLGKEVVPMAAIECTSAIIKIRRGDTFELVARTASGGITKLKGDEEIQMFLKDHATISKKYGNIPITTINNKMIIPLKGKKPSEKEIELFLKDVADDNIYQLEINLYNDLIRTYIEQNINSWSNIITEIDITYPLPEEMQGITIIDSPGVAARGDVGQVTKDYIEKANAIIFVKSLNGQALANKTFMEFMRDNCTKRNRDSLFLVFTGKEAGVIPRKELPSLKEQALELYKRDINSEKIIFVDSKVQLFLNKCNELETAEAIDEYFEKLYDNEEDFPVASECWHRARGDVSKFNERMEELSNFRSVQTTLEKFSRVASYYQLIEFLDNLEKEYKRQKSIFDNLLKTSKESVDDPQALEDKIRKQKREIDIVFGKIHDGIDEIYRLYTDPIQSEGRILDKVEEKRKEYESKLENFRNLTESEIETRTFGELKTMTMTAIEDSKKFRRKIAMEIIEECNKKLILYTDDPDMISADAFNPNFTETDFDKIDASAKESSSGFKDVETGLTFKTVERKAYYHKDKHVRTVANSIRSRLNEIVDEMKENLMTYVEECTKEYRTKLNAHKVDLEDDYNRFLEEQKKNNDLLKTIADLETHVSKLINRLKEIEKLKGELRNYVGE